MQAELTTFMLDRFVPEAVFLNDKTSGSRKGDHSVGLAQPYCGALGTTANGQVAVSVRSGIDTACLPLTWSLYLPQARIDDADRRTAARARDLHENHYGVGCAGSRARLGRRRAPLTARGVPYRVQVAPSIPRPPWRPSPQLRCRLGCCRRYRGTTGAGS